MGNQLTLEGKKAKSKKQIKKETERRERKARGLYNLHCFGCGHPFNNKNEVIRDNGMPYCDECFGDILQDRAESERLQDCDFCEICGGPINKGSRFCYYHEGL